jgi:hypothetical protein
MKRVRGRDENRSREEIKCTDSLRAKSPGHCHSPQYIQSVCTVQNATPFICFVMSAQNNRFFVNLIIRILTTPDLFFLPYLIFFFVRYAKQQLTR